jgi:hypothetical protein
MRELGEVGQLLSLGCGAATPHYMHSLSLFAIGGYHSNINLRRHE